VRAVLGHVPCKGPATADDRRLTAVGPGFALAAEGEWLTSSTGVRYRFTTYVREGL